MDFWVGRVDAAGKPIVLGVDHRYQIGGCVKNQKKVDRRKVVGAERGGQVCMYYCNTCVRSRPGSR